MNKTILATTIVTLVTVGFSTSLLAHSNDAATTAAQQNSAVSMEQAIEIAEQVTGGKKADAEFELENGQAIYEVEITMTNGSEVEVTIDAQSGAILSQETENDNDDHKEEDDDKDETKNRNSN